MRDDTPGAVGKFNPAALIENNDSLPFPLRTYFQKWKQHPHLAPLPNPLDVFTHHSSSPTQIMGFFQFAWMSLLAVIARTQELQNCSVGAIAWTVASTEDAGSLAASILGCSDGDFAVQWVGEVYVEDTIRVTSGTSLVITGAGPGAIADGGGDTQLFAVEGGSRLHLSDMTLSNGNASYGGGAIFANLSSVSFTGIMSFISNTADFGGAVYSTGSNVSWVGNGTRFGNNLAGKDGGAIAAINSSTLSTANTTFSGNVAGVDDGALVTDTREWKTEVDPFVGTVFVGNSAGRSGGAIFLENGENTLDFMNVAFDSNSANGTGGAVAAHDSACWFRECTFSNNKADGIGGAVETLRGLQKFSSCDFEGNLGGEQTQAMH